MATLPNMGIELPELGGDAGSWDDKLNAGLGVIDEHDHTEGKGAPITTDAISIDADLSFNGHGGIAFGKVGFSAVVPLTDGALAFFVSSADNELYFRNASGTNIKLTSGATLNLSLVGGILGDYATVGAEFAYDAANERYTAKQPGSPKPWARLASGPVQIHEHGTTENAHVELAAPAALAAPYTLTLPDALPAATALLHVAADGTSEFSERPTVQSVNVTEDYAHTALFRASLPLTLDAAGSGLSKTSGIPNEVVVTNNTSADYFSIHLSALGLRVGDRVRVIRLGYRDKPVGEFTVALYHHRWDLGTDSYIQLSGPNTDGTVQILPGTGGAGVVIEDNPSTNNKTDQMWVRATFGSGFTGTRIVYIDVMWDHPES